MPKQCLSIPIIAYFIFGIAVNTFAKKYEVKPLSDDLAEEYELDQSFYKKATYVQDILIATSDRVSDYAHKEAAYLYDKIMRSITPKVAQRIRD